MNKLSKTILLLMLIAIVVLLWPMWWTEKPETDVPNYGLFEVTCSCDHNLTGTYIAPYYYFTCRCCDRVHTNTNVNTVQEFYTLVDFDG